MLETIRILFFTTVILLLSFRCFQLNNNWVDVCHSLNLNNSSSKEEVIEKIKIILLEDKGK